eukprot:244128_1
MSVYWTCKNDLLFLSIYSGTTCSVKEKDLQDPLHPFDCDTDNEYNDYIQYTIWDLNLISETPDCDHVARYERPNSFAQIINKCVYEPAFNTYKIDACTDTLWTTHGYYDNECQNLIQYTSYSFNQHEECKVNETFIEITECITPINSIGDNFGYVQPTKSSYLRPLNQCIQSSTDNYDYSYLYTCTGTTLYTLSWSDQSCGDTSTAVVEEAISFAFSCSTNTHVYGRVNMYANDNDCGAFNPDDKHNSFPGIANQCYNFFDENNEMRSEIMHCNETMVWSVIYNLTDCDANGGSYLGLQFTDGCSEGSEYRYVIDCSHTTTTTAFPTTTSTHYATTTSAVFTPAPTPSGTRIIYVRSDANNSLCYNQYNDDGICGTLKDASFAAQDLNLYYNITDIEIIVQGQNPTQINARKERDRRPNPCVPQSFHPFATDLRQITYTFDPNYIHSMSDWYDPTLCEDIDGNTLEHFFGQTTQDVYFTYIINNLIIDSYSFDGRRNQPYLIAFADTFICNHCQFRDIVINSSHHDKVEDDGSNQVAALILAANVELNDCIVDNVTYLPSSYQLYDSYGYDHSFITIESTYQLQYASGGTSRPFSVSMTNNTTVSNIDGLSSFIHAATIASVLDFRMLVDHVTFDHISIVDAIIYNAPDGLETLSSSIVISNANFLNINHGSILYSLYGYAIITISNINITTSQTIERYVQKQQAIGRDNLDFYSLFVFDSGQDIVAIRDVNIEYHYAHEIAIRCVDVYGGSTYNTMMSLWYLLEMQGVPLDFYHFMYYCEYPIQLIHNSAVMVIHDLFASNDITDSITQAFREFIKSEMDAMGVDYSNHDVYFEFAYRIYREDDEYYGDYAMISSTNQLTVNGLYAYGYAAHATMILSIDAELTVTNMIAIPDTYCTTNHTACEFDADALQIDYWIRFNGKGSKCDDNVLTISNSSLYGAKTWSIMAGGGYVMIRNTTIQMSASGVLVDNDVVYVEIISSEMRDIGVYYSASSRWLWAHAKTYVPFALIPYELVIKDTVFSYISPFQFDLFDATDFFDLVSADVYGDQTRKITMIGNTFEINDINVVTSSYPANQTLHFVDEYDYWDSKNKTFDMGYDQHFVYHASMLIPNDADVQLINNRFSINPHNIYATEKTLLANDVAFVALNQSRVNSSVHVCISGNEFTNFAIWVLAGNITSCVKVEMMDYIGNEDCNSYGTFGAMSQTALAYNDGKSNVFNVYSNDVSTVIRTEEGSSIALENNIFRIYDNNTDLLNIMSGNHLLINTIIEYANTSINHSVFNILINDRNCNINCYSRADETFMSVLHVTCLNYYTNATFEDSVSIDTIYEPKTDSLSPLFVDIFTLNNGDYVPGQKLPLNYSLFDMYDHPISHQIIRDPIVVTYQSSTDDLLPDFQLIINENGECPQCDDGILFSALTVALVGNNYSFDSSVENHQLLPSSAMDITVVNCPIGHGSTTTSVCDVCKEGYFNLFDDDNNMCYYCNQLLVDGVRCLGSYAVLVDYDYWASFYQYSQLSDAIFDQNTSLYIISHKCPPLYCCQLENGCNVIEDYDYLCADHRDVEAPLCGACIDGYSEMFGTNDCGECDHNYWSRLLIPLFYGLAWALFVLMTKSSPKKSDKLEQGKCKLRMAKCKRKCTACMEVMLAKCKRKCTACSVCAKSERKQKKTMTHEEYMECMEVMLSKILLYYYQGLSYILTTSGIHHTLRSFVELFNLNVFMISSGRDADGYCLFEDMDMIQKITVPLTASLFIIFFTFLPFAIAKCKIDICKCTGRQLHFGKSFISVMLICVGQVMAVLFKLLACRDIGNISVHYFFGAEECYNTIWNISFVSLMVLFAIFVALFIWIWYRKGNDTEKELEIQKQKAYRPVVSAYTKQYWFWESILFVRRTILAFAFIVFDNDELKVCVAIILLLYAFVQENAAPFRYRWENHLETLVVVMTVISICIAIIYSLKTDGMVFSNVVLAILIVLPLLCYVLFMMIHCSALGHPDDDNDHGCGAIEMVDADTDEEDPMVALKPRKDTRDKPMPRADGTDSTMHPYLPVCTVDVQDEVIAEEYNL